MLMILVASSSRKVAIEQRSNPTVLSRVPLLDKFDADDAEWSMLVATDHEEVGSA